MFVSLSRCLALLAVIAISGVHLPFMQMGAWGMMLWEREATDHSATLARAVGEMITQGESCQRCRITMRASLKAPTDSREQKRPASPETAELRLIPAHWECVAIIPPSPHRLPRHHVALGLPEAPCGVPVSPPPEMGMV